MKSSVGGENILDGGKTRIKMPATRGREGVAFGRNQPAAWLVSEVCWSPALLTEPLTTESRWPRKAKLRTVWLFIGKFPDS